MTWAIFVAAMIVAIDVTMNGDKAKEKVALVAVLLAAIIVMRYLELA